MCPAVSCTHETAVRPKHPSGCPSTSGITTAVLQGVRAKQHDAWDLGVVTNDVFGNADVNYPLTLPVGCRKCCTR